VNRPPQVADLKPLYVRYNKTNTYQIDAEAVRDPDDDPVVFVPIAGQLPEGARLTARGEFTWTPSVTQFNRLRTQPARIEFFVEDQPAKARTRGVLQVSATQMDLPPVISIVPNERTFEARENVTLNLKFYLSDPNGDDDVQTFGFVANHPGVPESALVENTPTQWEFVWMPDYDFVRDPDDSTHVRLTFFALDKAQKRDELHVDLLVRNAVNEEERDRKLYTDYRNTLVRAWELLEQLKEKEEELKRAFRRAKRGKKNRSIANASMGAVTGVTPVIGGIPDPTKQVISTVGGTTVLTVGTLEATEVIGRSTKDLLDRLNYVMEKRNDLQTRGDAFARTYVLRSSRREAAFVEGVQEMRSVMALKGVVAVELDAGWQSKKRATDRQLRKTFRDFAPDDLGSASRQ
ncbi:MAG: hypothetical protein WBA12_08290, partial [Catalinimonas sp.]